MAVEERIARNTPMEIMRIAVPDGEVKRERAVMAQAKPMEPGLDWLQGAERIQERLDAASQDIRTDPESYLEALKQATEHVLAYNPDWPADAIRTEATGQQITGAMLTLMELNDPFAVRRKRQAEEIERMIGIVGKDGMAHFIKQAQDMRTQEGVKP